MANEWENKDLPRAKGKIAPAQWNADSVAWEPYEGVRKLEQKLNDIDNRLQGIENGNTTVNTQVTGSIAENKSRIVFDKVTFASGRTHSSSQTNKFCKGIIVSVQVHEIVGEPINGVNVWLRFELGGNDYGAYVLPSMTETVRRIAIIYPGVSSDFNERSDINFIDSGVVPEKFNLEIRNKDSDDNVEYNCTITYSLIL